MYARIVYPSGIPHDTRFMYVSAGLQKAENSRRLTRTSKDTRVCHRPRGIHNHRSDIRSDVQTRAANTLHSARAVFSDIFIGRCLLSIPPPLILLIFRVSADKQIGRSSAARGFLVKALILIIPLLPPRRYRSRYHPNERTALYGAFTQRTHALIVLPPHPHP